MFFGGRLYPDAASLGAAGVAVAFDEDELDCAAMGKDATQAKSAPAKRRFKAFWSGIVSSPSIHLQEPADSRILRGFKYFAHPATTLKSASRRSS
jgi:hypothetical protein